MNFLYNRLSKYISFYLILNSKLQSNYKLIINLKQKLIDKQKRYFLFFINQFKFYKKLKFTKLETMTNNFIFKKKQNLIFNFPYLKNNIPKLSDFEFGSIEWPKVK